MGIGLCGIGKRGEGEGVVREKRGKEFGSRLGLKVGGLVRRNRRHVQQRRATDTWWGSSRMEEGGGEGLRMRMKRSRKQEVGR